MPFQIVPHGEYYINKEKNTYQSPPRREIIALSILKSEFKKCNEWNQEQIIVMTKDLDS